MRTRQKPKGAETPKLAPGTTPGTPVPTSPPPGEVASKEVGDASWSAKPPPLGRVTQSVPGSARPSAPSSVAEPTLALIQRGKAGRAELQRHLLAAHREGTLPEVFAGVVNAGQYEELLRVVGRKNDELMRALASARPTYGADALNAETVAEIRANPEWKRRKFHAILVPGFTPLNAQRPVALEALPVAKRRLDVAVEDFRTGKAPIVVVSGGSVHPPGTPHNEALMMREYLIGKGIPSNRILVDPYAQHSTTNLRNTGRLLAPHGLNRVLIATGFDHAQFNQRWYFAHPYVSTFHLRCAATLGYPVGRLRGVDEHHVEFTPSPQCSRLNMATPMDP